MTSAQGHETAAAAEAMRRDGYVVLRNVFTREETVLLKKAIAEHPDMNARADYIRDKFESGKYPSFESIFVWNDTSGDDIFAKFTRRAEIMRVLEAAFDDKVYVYHNKVALKYPRTPGFKFHQDYYYWYQMGCLYPDMATCFIAIDDATTENGCLKLVEGSHRLGRVDHTLYDGVSDSGVDEERLAAILERMPVRDIELNAGDCVAFLATTLHGSDANMSDKSRIALLGCYNTKHNDPYVRTHEHPNYIAQSHVTDRVTAPDVAKLPDFKLHYRNQ